MSPRYEDSFVRKMAVRFASTRPWLEAEDVAQELRIAWWRAEHHGHPGPLGLHFALRRLRSMPARPVSCELTEQVMCEHGAGPGYDPEKVSCVRKIRRVVSPTHWYLLRRVADGWSCSELAAEHGTAKATVWRHLTVAKQAARAALEEAA